MVSFGAPRQFFDRSLQLSRLGWRLLKMGHCDRAFLMSAVTLRVANAVVLAGEIATAHPVGAVRGGRASGPTKVAGVPREIRTLLIAATGRRGRTTVRPARATDTPARVDAEAARATSEHLTASGRTVAALGARPLASHPVRHRRTADTKTGATVRGIGATRSHLPAR